MDGIGEQSLTARNRFRRLVNPFAQHLGPLSDLGSDSIWHQAPLPISSVPSGLAEPLAPALPSGYRLSFQGLELLALSGPKADSPRIETQALSLLYVCAGEVHLSVDQLRWSARAGSCLVIPPGGLRWQSSAYSVVCLMLDWASVCDSLQRLSIDPLAQLPTLRGVGCPWRIEAAPGALEACLLASLDQELRLMAALLGGASHPVIRQDMAGHLFRLAVLLALPGLGSGSVLESAAQPDRQIETAFDDLIDYILANLDQPLNLTLLERRSHYGRRSLQYAFQEHFGCTATQWIRAQRLDRAHAMLLQPGPDITVAAIAKACGYRSMGLFSLEFQQRFHRKPSQLLRQCRPD